MDYSNETKKLSLPKPMTRELARILERLADGTSTGDDRESMDNILWFMYSKLAEIQLEQRMSSRRQRERDD